LIADSQHSCDRGDKTGENKNANIQVENLVFYFHAKTLIGNWRRRIPNPGREDYNLNILLDIAAAGPILIDQ
jgi:hypothetical protein